MKGLLPLLLILLGLCFHEANSKPCPSLVVENDLFIAGPSWALKKHLEKYGAPQEAVAAKMEVKQCIDGLDLKKRALLKGVLVKVLAECLFHWQKH
ncbi:secretoglobin family 1D member 2-like [Perognathus longimembris pacificus]|uniref:secretoglobin family 1D member 2-like n=1 Tax=Perognathus longimembris pacificus TaxID=214514 RepID=UPI0020192303|nr:secretoglobin family 1D member 2-like [Perognathus longimembris pacificus]